MDNENVDCGWVKKNWILPDWPAPACVKACITTRLGGVSPSPFESCNLALYVGDDRPHVLANRHSLQKRLQLPRVQWLTQVHGTRVVEIGGRGGVESDVSVTADGSTTTCDDVVCAVLTADCLPVLLCDRQGTRVAALHAGWRGLAGGVLAAGVERFTAPVADLLAYLGPAISQPCFEVGAEVLEAFLAAAHTPEQSRAIEAAFAPGTQDPLRYRADLYALARAELRALGVTAVYGGGLCTFRDSQRFFSYRRKARTGRMASLIWLQGISRNCTVVDASQITLSGHS